MTTLQTVRAWLQSAFLKAVTPKPKEFPLERLYIQQTSPESFESNAMTVPPVPVLEPAKPTPATQHILDKLKPVFNPVTDLIIMSSDHWEELVDFDEPWLMMLGDRIVIFGTELKNSAIVRSGYGYTNKSHMGFL